MYVDPVFYLNLEKIINILIECNMQHTADSLTEALEAKI